MIIIIKRHCDIYIRSQILSNAGRRGLGQPNLVRVQLNESRCPLKPNIPFFLNPCPFTSIRGSPFLFPIFSSLIPNLRLPASDLWFSLSASPNKPTADLRSLTSGSSLFPLFYLPFPLTTRARCHIFSYNEVPADRRTDKSRHNHIKNLAS